MFSSSSSDSDEENYDIIQRRRKIFRIRCNYTFSSIYEYNERFRMTSQAMESLLEDIGHQLQHPTGKSGALTAKQQLCIALHWFGSGCQFHAVGDMHGVSKSSVFRSVHSVVDAVNLIKFRQIVNWPMNMVRVAQDFYAVAGFPNVCGIVDGTLICIDAPMKNEADFVDRHGKHSINCMFVCGPDYTFYYVSANWPGSVHDARVLRNSMLATRMENGWRPFPQAIILGDSAYPLKNWLIPPYRGNAFDDVQAEFNRRHKSTRRIIENALGIMKEKFPCLNYLRLNPVFAANVIKCCATLCNISRNPDDLHRELHHEEEVDPKAEHGDEEGYIENDMVHAQLEIMNFFEQRRARRN
ncbi:putative nuclease HARBI1 [Bacillus rossius redtenbacheri]|uniref:putative nuclease HARBI1 n=1 Tax=Bacillus rossius redtenbacheri TaxID=93214 RepID=UPI002FDDFF4E